MRGGGGTNALHVQTIPFRYSWAGDRQRTSPVSSGLRSPAVSPTARCGAALASTNHPRRLLRPDPSSGYDFEPRSPVSATQHDQRPRLRGRSNKQTFNREDFIYGPQSGDLHRVSDYPVFVEQDMSDAENTFELMFMIPARLYPDKVRTLHQGRVRVHQPDLVCGLQRIRWYSARTTAPASS